MYSNSAYRQENSPFIQLLYVFMLAILGLIVFAVIGFLVIYLFYGFAGFKGAISGDLKYTGAFKILLTSQQLGLFLSPALFLGIVEGRKPHQFYGLKIPKGNLLLLVAILSVCWMPIMGLVNELNQKMVFPDFLKGLEAWMRAMEDEGAKTTEAILKMKTITDLLVNLLVIAIVPAICEEFIFRGAIQRTLFRMIDNPHVAIWTAAIIFSTIHFQFYGFVPRMLLGAAFGYVYFWTGSLWYAIFAHFLNNAYAVFVAFYLQVNNLSYTKADDIQMPWYGYLISVILTLALFKLLKDRTENKLESTP
ncbi:CPBP family intramembrane glutamic endopeptidase [Pedobacter sp. ASV28]|uniref:CPBP family intramembrane glutamic endopeptidase n=1 Tax=Pedobacter sp. ASV28 TaxID=2795123 RepID=UPI0018EBDC99|nr:CPBP family intramembrane glutamic endopeptidase [Pedobacter sp. ASV28]